MDRERFGRADDLRNSVSKSNLVTNLRSDGTPQVRLHSQVCVETHRSALFHSTRRS